MIGLIQRVSQASVTVNSTTLGNIQNGVLLLLCAEKGDTSEQVASLAKKVANIRIFEDSQGKMNNSLSDINGELLVISQFTLAADTRKGNRPGFSQAAPPEIGEKLYLEFIAHYQQYHGTCQQGQFGANMQVALVNDGPATFIIQV